MRTGAPLGVTREASKLSDDTSNAAAPAKDAGAALSSQQTERLSPFRVESKLSTSPRQKPPSGANLPQGWRPRTPNRGRLCGYQSKKAARRGPSTKVLMLRQAFFRRKAVNEHGKPPELCWTSWQLTSTRDPAAGRAASIGHLCRSAPKLRQELLAPIARIKTDSIPCEPADQFSWHSSRSFSMRRLAL